MNPISMYDRGEWSTPRPRATIAVVAAVVAAGLVPLALLLAVMG